MADTNFSDRAGSTPGTTIVAAWLNALNKWAFWGRRPNYAVTTGSANAQVLTLETGSLYTTEADGDVFSFTAGFTNTLAMTLQVVPPAGTNTARAVQIGGSALAGGEFVAGRTYTVTRLGTTWQLASLASLTAAVLRALISPLTTKGDLWGFSTLNTRLGVGSDGQTICADSSQTSGLIYLDNPSRPNLLVNPNNLFDQVNEGALYTVNTTNVRTLDGLSGTAAGTGTFKIRRLVDPSHASLWVSEITCTVADVALAASDDYFIYRAVEGYDAAAFLYGESGAKAGTFQFDFQSNLVGVYGVSVMNSAGNRRYVGSITVADTAEHTYSLQFTADTTGTWLFTNGVGCYLRICLAAGSNFQTATPNTWAAGAEQTVGAQVNFMSSVSNVAYLKRAQFIPGALVQAYAPANVQKELALVQRQYFKTFAQGAVVQRGAGTNTGEFVWNGVNASTTFGAYLAYPVTLRAVPTLVTYNPNDGTSAEARDQTATVNCTATAAFNAGTSGTGVQATQTAGGAQGNRIAVHLTADSRLS